MKKSLIYFSYLIIVSNFLFFVVGISANIGFVGAFMGGLMAIGTDPIIIMMGIIIGTALVVHQSSFSVIYLWLAAMFSTMLIHVVLDTTKVFVDIVRFDALLIIPALIIIVTSFFSPQIKSIKPKVKINTDPSKQRGVRLLVLIFSAAIFGFILFSGQTKFSNKNYITKTVVGKYITKPIIKEFHIDENGYLRGNYRHSMWIAHTVIFILLMAIVFMFRFHITHKLTSFTRLAEMKPVKTKSSVPESIKNFFKNI